MFETELTDLLRPPYLLPSPPRLKAFKARLFSVFQESHAQSVGMVSLLQGVNKEQAAAFSDAEVRAALSRMQDDNQVMVADDIIFLI